MPVGRRHLIRDASVPYTPYIYIYIYPYIDIYPYIHMWHAQIHRSPAFCVHTRITTECMSFCIPINQKNN